jgi:hypothetical protein
VNVHIANTHNPKVKEDRQQGLVACQTNADPDNAMLSLSSHSWRHMRNSTWMLGYFGSKGITTANQLVCARSIWSGKMLW